MVAWQKTVVLVVDVDQDLGLIGWSGFADEQRGLSTLTSMGLGVASLALSEIASWLHRETQVGTVPGDGPTDG